MDRSRRFKIQEGKNRSDYKTLWKSSVTVCQYNKRVHVLHYHSLLSRVSDVCHRNLLCKVSAGTKGQVKPGSHIPPTYLQRSRRLQLTTFGDLSQWIPGSSAMDRRHTQIYSKCKSNCAISKYFTCKYGSNRLTGVCCIRRWCSHKIFSLPTTTANRQLACEVELSSTSQASRRSMPGIDYDSAIKLTFTYAITVSQAVPAAMSQVCRRHMRTRLNPGSAFPSLSGCSQPLDLLLSLCEGEREISFVLGL